MKSQNTFYAILGGVVLVLFLALALFVPEATNILKLVGHGLWVFLGWIWTAVAWILELLAWLIVWILIIFGAILLAGAVGTLVQWGDAQFGGRGEQMPGWGYGVLGFLLSLPAAYFWPAIVRWLAGLPFWMQNWWGLAYTHAFRENIQWGWMVTGLVMFWIGWGIVWGATRSE